MSSSQCDIGFLPGWSRAEIKCTVHIALPKRPINQFKLDQQIRKLRLRPYCPNIYTVPFFLSGTLLSGKYFRAVKWYPICKTWFSPFILICSGHLTKLTATRPKSWYKHVLYDQLTRNALHRLQNRYFLRHLSNRKFHSWTILGSRAAEKKNQNCHKYAMFSWGKIISNFF